MRPYSIKDDTFSELHVHPILNAVSAPDPTNAQGSGPQSLVLAGEDAGGGADLPTDFAAVFSEETKVDRSEAVASVATAEDDGTDKDAADSSLRAADAEVEPAAAMFPAADLDQAERPTFAPRRAPPANETEQAALIPKTGPEPSEPKRAAINGSSTDLNASPSNTTRSNPFPDTARPSPPVNSDQAIFTAEVNLKNEVLKSASSLVDPEQSRPKLNSSALSDAPINTAAKTGGQGNNLADMSRPAPKLHISSNRRGISDTVGISSHKELNHQLPTAEQPIAQPLSPTPKGQPSPSFSLQPPRIVHADPKSDSRSSTVVTNAEEPFAFARVDQIGTGAAQINPNIPTRMDLPAHVSRQIADALQHMPGRPVEITLSPEELGRVRLAMSSSDAGIVVSVLAERSETMELLRRHIGNLESAFHDLGYQDIAFSFSDSGSHTGGEDRRNGREERPVGDAFDDHSDLPTTQILLASGSQTGIDIRL